MFTFLLLLLRYTDKDQTLEENFTLLLFSMINSNEAKMYDIFVVCLSVCMYAMCVSVYDVRIFSFLFVCLFCSSSKW